MHFQIHLLRPCGRIWFSSVQRAQRLEGEKERKKEEEEEEEEESLVKYKFADSYMSGGLIISDRQMRLFCVSTEKRNVKIRAIERLIF